MEGENIIYLEVLHTTNETSNDSGSKSAAAQIQDFMFYTAQ